MNTTKSIESRADRSALRVTILLLLITMLVIACNSFIVNAKGSTQPITHKYYTEVRISRGESLWSIAEEYMTDEYSSIKAYMEEVMDINSMLTTDVYYGQKMMIPYYSEEIK